MSQPKKRKLRSVDPPSPIKQESDLPDQDPAPESSATSRAENNKYKVAMVALGYNCNPALLQHAVFKVDDCAISKNKKTGYLVKACGWDSKKSAISYALAAQNNGQVAFVDEDDLLEPEKRMWSLKDADDKDVLQFEFTKIGCQGNSGGIHSYTYTGSVTAVTDEDFRVTNKLTLAMK